MDKNSTKGKLKDLFKFLKKNRKYNHAVQKVFYKSFLLPHNSTSDRVIALLNGINSTQSRPKINLIGPFIKEVAASKKKLESFRGFSTFLKVPNNKISFDQMFIVLKGKNGWGEKTAAFFVKAIYQLHSREFDKDLRLWEDIPKELTDNDRLYLPVDTVITHIFKSIGIKTATFKEINKLLHESGYKNRDILIWDDLWFWGFITQEGGSDERSTKFNENKYLAYQYFDKSPKTLRDITEHATEFIALLEKLK